MRNLTPANIIIMLCSVMVVAAVTFCLVLGISALLPEVFVVPVGVAVGVVVSIVTGNAMLEWLKAP